ncbi:MAG: sigma-70 family RNA polymerase sigma factor [Chloroflexi bacterium]|nr:sigma-70 family RNA polymerase sigma factor [Chloroflexota bacterium]
MTESDWIQAARRGDVESFNRLVLLYQDIAYNVAYRLMGDPDAAADATQDAFITAFRKLHQLEGDRFRPWLLRIVTNACYDELRRRRRRPAASLDDLHERAEVEPVLALSNPPENPEQHAQRRELNLAIQDCLSALPENQRTVAVLADVQEYPYQEIAAITGLALGTVKSRLSRARAHLRDCLQAVQELLPAEYRLIDEQTSDY